MKFYFKSLKTLYMKKIFFLLLLSLMVLPIMAQTQLPELYVSLYRKGAVLKYTKTSRPVIGQRKIISSMKNSDIVQPIDRQRVYIHLTRVHRKKKVLEIVRTNIISVFRQTHSGKWKLVRNLRQPEQEVVKK